MAANICRPETFLQPEMSSFWGGFGVLKYINITHITCPAYFGEIGGFGVFGVHTKSPSTRNTKKQFLGFLVVLVVFWGFWWDFIHLCSERALHFDDIEFPNSRVDPHLSARNDKNNGAAAPGSRINGDWRRGVVARQR